MKVLTLWVQILNQEPLEVVAQVVVTTQGLSGFTGGLENIIANGNADAPTVVTIAPTDAGFESQRCGTWTRVE
jgi:hypothetical protein